MLLLLQPECFVGMYVLESQHVLTVWGVLGGIRGDMCVGLLMAPKVANTSHPWPRFPNRGFNHSFNICYNHDQLLMFLEATQTTPHAALLL